MSKPYHIPAWEIPLLERIARCMDQRAREEALQIYITERERRRRHAVVRDERDRDRRTLVGAHMPKEQAYMVAKMAEARGMSMTAFIKEAVLRASSETASASEKELRPLWVTSLERGTF